MSDAAEPSVEVAFRLRGIEVTYAGPPPVHALRGVDLDLVDADHVVLTGPSGSGKSTLLNVLGLLDRATGGSYVVEGDDVTTMADDRLAALRSRCFGFVFQRFHLLPALSAEENVQLGLQYASVPRNERRTLARRALARVGLDDRAEHRPTELSGGQQQRVAIARAVARSPRFLLADEPTGNLDSRTSEEILEMLDALVADGMGLVTVTHDMSVAARARRRFVVEDGILSEEAP